jgi:quinol-cytochrome oxidoreductase complex cytochrome b subunit
MSETPRDTQTPPPDSRSWLERRVNLTEIASFLTVFGLLPAELDTRKPLREALGEALSQPMSYYERWPRLLGLLAFVLFLLLGVTGILLAFYYQPTADAAYPSVVAIARDVSLGSLVHQVHAWASILFLFLLAFRVIRFFFMGLYGRGREIIWMVGVLAFVVATFTDLTGRLLPWDARGYWTTVRAREVIDALPLIGPIVTFLVGGKGLDSLILTRFYVLHIGGFPFVLLILFYLHFASIRRVGVPVPLEAAQKPRVGRALRIAGIDMILLVLLMLGVLLTFAIVVPIPFDVQADPFATPPNAHAPWYLLAPHAVLEALPGLLPRFVRGLLLDGLLAGFLFLPFLDRSPGTGVRNRAFLAAGLALLVAWVLLTWHGWFLEVSR